MTKEKWKDVVGFEGLYMVSSLGRVKSLDKVVTYSDGRVYTYFSKVLSPCLTNGYPRVTLTKDRKYYPRKIHILQAQAFFGDANGRNVNHKDGNRQNNNLSNLEYITQRENVLHGKRVNGLVGAQWVKNRKHWRSIITVAGKQKYLGSFKTEIEAHNAYMEEIKRLNLPHKYAGDIK